MPQATGWGDPGVVCRGFQQSDLTCAASTHPVRLEGDDDKINRQQDGDGLRKDEPKAFHNRKL
jgi:hypothetical protein